MKKEDDLLPKPQQETDLPEAKSEIYPENAIEPIPPNGKNPTIKTPVLEKSEEP